MLDGRYIYSMRGGAGAIIDQFDIAGGTAGAGSWAAVTYIGSETFTTGSSATIYKNIMYIRQNAANRFFKYNITGNYIDALSTNMFSDSTATLGDKIWTKSFDQPGNVFWLYSLMNTGTSLHRLMIY